MTAIIPVAGAGTRLRPFTYTQPKPLIPVAGKPILSYIVEQLVGLGVGQFVFVIGYLGEKVQDFVEETYPQLDTRFVLQEERRGSGHAVWLAREALGGAREVVIVFGDTILEGRLDHVVNCETTCMAIKPVEDPRSFGVVELDADGRIARMVEKPRMPKSNKALVGFYKVSDYALLHDTLGQVLAEAERSDDDEVTLTDGLMAMLDAGHAMHAEHVDRWYDCGNPEVLLRTNRTLLDGVSYAEAETPAFDGCIFVHPVSIGRGCEIRNAIIGPYVSLGDHSVVERAILSDCIVGRYTRLDNVTLEHSVVGNDTALAGRPQRINIGDNTELSLG